MADFHNNLGIDDEELTPLINMAKSQDNRVLCIFNTIPDKVISRWPIQKIYNRLYKGKKLSDLSLGRTLRNLSAKGYLLIVGKEMGEKGVDNFIYKLNPNPPQCKKPLPKKVDVNLIFIDNSDGTRDLNYQEMLQTFNAKFNSAKEVLKLKNQN